MSDLESFTAESFGPLIKNVPGGELSLAYEHDYLLDTPLNIRISKATWARNLLRFFIHGTPVERSQPYQKGLEHIEKALVDKNDPDILKALLFELESVFLNTIDIINNTDRADPNYANKEKLFTILISNLVALYPFFAPAQDEKLDPILIPQKINGQWELISHQPKRIDLSPKTGILSYHDKKDKLFAYGFVPVNKPDIPSLLSFRGTPPPTLSGYKFANLFNFKPMSSIGEGHHMDEVDAFILSQPNKVDVFGHSQGATLALMTAMRHPTGVRQAHALNPVPLSFMTLRRLNPHWKAHLNQEGVARLNIYAQKGDLALYLDDGFPEGAHYYELEPETSLCSNYKRFMPKFLQRRIEAHIRFFAGQGTVKVTEMDLNQVNRSSWRDFFGDLKIVFNVVIFPIDKLALMVDIVAERVLPKFVLWLLKPISKLLSFAQTTIQWALLFILIPPMALGSGVKIAIKNLYFCAYDPLPEKVIQFTTPLSALGSPIDQPVPEFNQPLVGPGPLSGSVQDSTKPSTNTVLNYLQSCRLGLGP